MFCKNCGKKISNNEKFCSNCGSPVVIVQTEYTNKTSANKKNKGKITGIIPGIVLIIVLILFGLLIESSTKDVIHIEQILDVNKYYKSAGETISINDLIELNGTPEQKEDWNYVINEQKSIPLTTLYYNNSTYEYVFHDNILVRININKNIQFNSQNDIFSMFNLSKHDITQIKNTGSSIRIYNSSVPDFWCGYNEKNIEWIKITYDTNIF